MQQCYRNLLLDDSPVDHYYSGSPETELSTVGSCFDRVQLQYMLAFGWRAGASCKFVKPVPDYAYRRSFCFSSDVHLIHGTVCAICCDDRSSEQRKISHCEGEIGAGIACIRCVTWPPLHTYVTCFLRGHGLQQRQPYR